MFEDAVFTSIKKPKGCKDKLYTIKVKNIIITVAPFNMWYALVSSTLGLNPLAIRYPT
jgi:hypothetical protein